jgi:hypothetical protein
VVFLAWARQTYIYGGLVFIWEIKALKIVINVSDSTTDEDKWKTEARTEGGAIQEYTLSYQNLVPSTSYTFRVIAYNKYGISYPVKSADAVSSNTTSIVLYFFLVLLCT